MSSFPNLYQEQPYIYNLERQISSQSLFVSQEAYDFALQSYPDINHYHRLGLLPNSIPDSFCVSFTPAPQPRRILIVSNHPSAEVDQACQRLTQQGITFQLLGQTGVARLTTAKLLKQYDIVISIGKTVQYCLGMGLPVYVYDRFGGPGYLNSQNFDQSLYANFSGRGFTKKSATKIATELTSGYTDAVAYQTSHLADFRTQFSLSNQLTRIFTELSPCHFSPLPADYLHYLRMTTSLTRDKVIAENALVDATQRDHELATAYTETSQKLAAEHSARAELQASYDALRADYDLIRKLPLNRCIRKLHHRFSSSKD